MKKNNNNKKIPLSNQTAVLWWERRTPPVLWHKAVFVFSNSLPAWYAPSVNWQKKDLSITPLMVINVVGESCLLPNWRGDVKRNDNVTRKFSEWGRGKISIVKYKWKDERVLLSSIQQMIRAESDFPTCSTQGGGRMKQIVFFSASGWGLMLATVWRWWNTPAGATELFPP